MSTALTSVEKINTLKQGIEAATGKTYGTLTEAVQGLKNGYGQGGTTEGGSTGSTAEEGINLSYTLNKDGTYVSKNQSIDSSIPSGVWNSKFVFVSDKIYTVEELLGYTIQTKKVYVPTGTVEEIRNIKITSDLLVSMTNDTFAFFDTDTELPILAVINEDMAGVDVTGNGFVLPSSAGTYLIYADQQPERRGSVFGSVSVTKPLGKPYFDTSRITNFNYFFVNNRGLDQLEAIDTSNANNLPSMFYNCTELKSAPLFDTSGVENLSNMFHFCTNLTNIPLYDTKNVINFGAMLKECTAITSFPQLDTSKGEYFNEMFYNCKSLTIIPSLDISNAMYLYNTFYRCTALKTLSLVMKNNRDIINTQTFQDCAVLENLTINKGWAISIYLNFSNNLTVESLHGMIENLADLTGLQQSKYFQVGATNLAKVDTEHIDMLIAKNWIYS